LIAAEGRFVTKIVMLPAGYGKQSFGGRRRGRVERAERVLGVYFLLRPWGRLCRSGRDDGLGFPPAPERRGLLKLAAGRRSRRGRGQLVSVELPAFAGMTEGGGWVLTWLCRATTPKPVMPAKAGICCPAGR
jgi:hypothetical protein